VTSSFSPEVEAAISAAAQKYGVSPDTMRRFAQIESSGDPNNTTGNYHGLFQLSNDEFAKHGGGDIYSATDNANAAAIKLKAESADFARKYGREPTAADLYLVHQQGGAGAAAHMANPEGIAWKNIRPYYKSDEIAKKAIWGNVPSDLKAKYGSVENMTSGQFSDMWRAKVEGAPWHASAEGDESAASPPTATAAPQTQEPAPPAKLVGGYSIPQSGNLPPPVNPAAFTPAAFTPAAGGNPAGVIDVVGAAKAKQLAQGYADGGRVDTRDYMAGVDPNVDAPPPLPERAYPSLPPAPPMPERARLPVTPLPPLLANNAHFSKVWELLHHNPSEVPYQDLITASRYLEHARQQKGTLTAEDQSIPSASLFDKFMEYLHGSGEQPTPQRLANGGKVSSTKNDSKRATVTGYIDSKTGGVSDKLAYNAGKDSYVLPADVVSGLGDGNSNAGAKILDDKYKDRAKTPSKATVPVKLSGGEYVIHPSAVKRAGGGNIDKGLDHFDSLVHRVRARTIHALNKKKAPIR
jgi:hypothetical protein